MKVLLVHNFYQSSSPSGEDTVYLNEVELLRSRGVTVIQHEKCNDDISGTLGRITAPLNTVWSKKNYQEVSALIKREKPDVAHFHNIWYLISPSAYYACKEMGIPVVQTLHNFRMFCANGLLLRNGRVCEECMGTMPWRSVAYGCYRESRFYSIPVAVAEVFHKMRRTWTEKIDAFIALTEFGKKKFIECGLPEDKMYVKPNFSSEPSDGITSFQDYAVFIGRLSEEKGIHVLIDAMKNLKTSKLQNLKSFSLKVIGDGPLRTELEKQVEDEKLSREIEFMGRKSHAECMELLSHAGFLVMPAICYENFPMSIAEAFACGKPVIASNRGAMASIINDHETGLLFEPGNAEALANAMTRLWEDEAACLEMGRKARAEFESKYTADKNFEMVMGIYGKVLKTRRQENG